MRKKRKGKNDREDRGIKCGRNEGKGRTGVEGREGEGRGEGEGKE